MIDSLLRLSSLLVGVALLLTGHGLQLALVPISAELMGWSSAAVGYLSSVYFLGFISGCFLIPPLVSQIGHIRVFAALTAVTTAVILSFALSDNFFLWLLLRFFSGAAIVGLYLVIESWLNSQLSNQVRGSVLSAYTAIVLTGLALGQLLLNADAPEGERLFIIAAIFIVLAALPVCLTRTAQPGSIPSARFSPRLVLQTSRTASLGAFAAGIVTGSFYGLGPLYGLQRGLGVAEVSIMMALGIAGGALLQLPLGRLSDHVDRRKVICGAMVFGTGAALLAVVVPITFTPGVMFFFGAAVMPIYALCLAHASDHIQSEQFLEVGTGLLMINASGSVIGPLVTSQLMENFGIGQFFLSHALVLAVTSLLVLIFIVSRRREAEFFTAFSPATTAAGQSIIELDPRSEPIEPEIRALEGEIITKSDP